MKRHYEASFHHVWECGRGSEIEIFTCSHDEDPFEALSLKEAVRMVVDEARRDNKPEIIAAMRGFAEGDRNVELGNRFRSISVQNEAVGTVIMPIIQTGLRFLVHDTTTIPRVPEYEGCGRLPYKRIAVEFRGQVPLHHAHDKLTRWYAFAMEYGSGGMDLIPQPDAYDNTVVFKDHWESLINGDGPPPIQVMFITLFDGVLQLMPFAILFAYRNNEIEGVAINVAPPDLLNQHKRWASFLMIVTRMAKCFQDFLGTINCHGVNQEVIPPLKMTSKRLKAQSQGKALRLEYRVVDALLPPSRSHSRHSAASDNGTHQRYHLRRGHMRRHPKDSTQMLWIDPYFAGDKELGVIVKDYEHRK